MLEDKEFFQKRGNWKKVTAKKVYIFKVEIENLKAECRNSGSMSKDYLKLKMFTKWKSGFGENYSRKEYKTKINSKNKYSKAKSFQENISSSVKNDSANVDIDFTIQPSASASNRKYNNIVEMRRKISLANNNEKESKADLKKIADQFEQMKKELQTQSSRNTFNEINLVNAEWLISKKEQVMDALQHYIKYSARCHQAPLQIATTNVTNQNAEYNSLVLTKNSDRNSKKYPLVF